MSVPRPEAESRWLRLLARSDARIVVDTNRHRTVSEAARHGIGGVHWGIRDRVFQRHVVYFVFRNRVQTIIGGRAGALGPSSFMWLAPGVKHSFAFDAVRHVTLIHIVFVVRAAGREQAPPHPALVFDRAAELEAPMRLLHERLRDERPYAAEAQRAALTVVSALAFARLRQSAVDAARQLDYAQRRLIDEYLARRRPSEVHPRDLARELGLTHDYFTRLFRATYGMSPRLWLNRERIQRAADDLRQGEGEGQGPRPIAELADAHGYPDVYAFSKQFKKATGLSPTRFRREQRPW